MNSLKSYVCRFRVKSGEIKLSKMDDCDVVDVINRLTDSPSVDSVLSIKPFADSAFHEMPGSRG
jgi:hypothetical protein